MGDRIFKAAFCSLPRAVRGRALPLRETVPLGDTTGAKGTKGAMAGNESNRNGGAWRERTKQTVRKKKKTNQDDRHCRQTSKQKKQKSNINKRTDKQTDSATDLHTYSKVVMQKERKKHACIDTSCR